VIVNADDLLGKLLAMGPGSPEHPYYSETVCEIIGLLGDIRPPAWLRLDGTTLVAYAYSKTDAEAMRGVFAAMYEGVGVKEIQTDPETFEVRANVARPK
jgi:hypothetical protein